MGVISCPLSSFVTQHIYDNATLSSPLHGISDVPVFRRPAWPCCAPRRGRPSSRSAGIIRESVISVVVVKLLGKSRDLASNSKSQRACSLAIKGASGVRPRRGAARRRVQGREAAPDERCDGDDGGFRDCLYLGNGITTSPGRETTAWQLLTPPIVSSRGPIVRRRVF